MYVRVYAASIKITFLTFRRGCGGDDDERIFAHVCTNKEGQKIFRMQIEIQKNT